VNERTEELIRAFRLQDLTDVLERKPDVSAANRIGGPISGRLPDRAEQDESIPSEPIRQGLGPYPPAGSPLQEPSPTTRPSACFVVSSAAGRVRVRVLPVASGPLVPPGVALRGGRYRISNAWPSDEGARAARAPCSDLGPAAFADQPIRVRGARAAGPLTSRSEVRDRPRPNHRHMRNAARTEATLRTCRSTRSATPSREAGSETRCARAATEHRTRAHTGAMPGIRRDDGVNANNGGQHEHHRRGDGLGPLHRLR
jgi:hypothetical protein